MAAYLDFTAAPLTIPAPVFAGNAIAAATHSATGTHFPPARAQARYAAASTGQASRE